MQKQLFRYTLLQLCVFLEAVLELVALFDSCGSDAATHDQVACQVSEV